MSEAKLYDNERDTLRKQLDAIRGLLKKYGKVYDYDIDQRIDAWLEANKK